jgi:hypothetical protein
VSAILEQRLGQIFLVPGIPPLPWTRSSWHHHPPGNFPWQVPGVKDLIAAIRAFIDGWHERCRPATWTKATDDILDHCRSGQMTSFT